MTKTTPKGPAAGKCPFHTEGGAGGGISDATVSDADRAKAAGLDRMLDGHSGQEDDFDHPMARAFSSYSGPLKPDHEEGNLSRTMTLYRIRSDELWPTTQDEHVEPWAQVTHDMLRSHITGEFFPCIGARGVFQGSTYRVGYYQDVAHESSVLAMGRDLRRFVGEYEKLNSFASFVALFKYPQSTNETQFEKLLFKHLQMLHDKDKSSWDPHYSPDPENEHFAYSFAGCSFFIVGMHSGSSRLSRLLTRPALIFNPESQIRWLIEHGKLDRFAKKVRERDTHYQGGINPSLPDDWNKTGGESAVYSGKFHPPGTFQCPFRPRPELLASSPTPAIGVGDTDETLK